MRRQARDSGSRRCCSQQGLEALHPQVLQIHRIPCCTPLHRERYLDCYGQGDRTVQSVLILFDERCFIIYSLLRLLLNLLQIREMTQEQANALKAPLSEPYRNNSRPVQPLNGRTVKLLDEKKKKQQQQLKNLTN